MCGPCNNSREEDGWCEHRGTDNELKHNCLYVDCPGWPEVEPDQPKKID